MSILQKILSFVLGFLFFLQAGLMNGVEVSSRLFINLSLKLEMGRVHAYMLSCWRDFQKISELKG